MDLMNDTTLIAGSSIITGIRGISNRRTQFNHVLGRWISIDERLFPSARLFFSSQLCPPEGDIQLQVIFPAFFWYLTEKTPEIIANAKMLI